MKKTEKNTGFTLIEMLIVIFFVGVGLVGVLTFFNSSLRSNFEAKNELIAAGLAQEGAELVRNLAEYKKLNGSDWNTIKNLLASCNHIDYRSLATHACQNSANNEICLASGQYKQCDGGAGIGIQRTLSISDGGANGLIVVSQVVWNDKTTRAEDRLYENQY